MTSKLIFAPIPLLLGGWMFASSFSSNSIQQSATPYSTQQQVVEVEIPEPAKSFLRFGGAAVAVLGTSSLVFWELASRKNRSSKPQLLLAAGQNFVPNTVPLDNNPQGISSVQDNQKPLANTKIPNQIQQPSVSPYNQNFPPQEVANFYQTGGLPESLSNDYDTLSNLKPQSSSQEKYVETFDYLDG